MDRCKSITFCVVFSGREYSFNTMKSSIFILQIKFVYAITLRNCVNLLDQVHVLVLASGDLVSRHVIEKQNTTSNHITHAQQLLLTTLTCIHKYLVEKIHVTVE